MKAGSMRYKILFVIFITIFGTFSMPRANALRDHLSVFFEFNALDSVIALEQKSASSLMVTVVDGATGETRNLKEDVGAKPMQKLLMEANDLGLKTIPLVPEETAVNPAEKAESKENPAKENAKASTVNPSANPPTKEISDQKKPGRSISSQRRNRMLYMANQTVLSTYIYGISLPIAFDNESSRVAIATPMLVAPFAFGAHFWFSKNRPFEDAHLKGTTYLSYSALYGSYALPYALLGNDSGSNTFRVASLISLAAYPLGIYGGYLLGDKYIDLPGRIETQQGFAAGFGIIGFFSPFLYYDDHNLDKHIELVVRLGLAQSVGMATLGHFMADNYRSGENIPGGVNAGIVNHSILGGGLGLEVAALADASTFRPWLGAALLGGTLGFMEGLYYHRNSYDTQERGLYNSLGMGAGTLFGAGLLYLFFPNDGSDYAQKNTSTALLLGGAALGYIATNILTDGMEDKPNHAAKPNWTDHLAVNLMPIPEPQIRNREIYLRYRMPGVSYRF